MLFCTTLVGGSIVCAESDVKAVPELITTPRNCLKRRLRIAGFLQLFPRVIRAVVSISRGLGVMGKLTPLLE